MGDFAGPSFSLGLDLDLDLESPPPPNPDGLISSIEDEDEDELETLVLDPQPLQPPILKRLKRGPPPPPPPPPPTQSCIKSVDVDVDDDEIEDISSPEEEDNPNRTPGTDQHSASALRRHLTTNSKPLTSNLHLLDSDSDSDSDHTNPNLNIPTPTPALDQFCQQYFNSVKDNSINQIKHKTPDQEKSFSGPLPPAYNYFYHHDTRIQDLVSRRLPHFFPHALNNTQTPPADIDYMGQFAPSKPSLEGSSRMGGMNCEDLSDISGSWVNPKGRTSMLKNAGKSQGRVAAPKNAGKRRVRADSRPSGSWFTGEDGRKVYVTKNGRELVGQIAYRHYRKESGTGFKKSRKKVASRKKSKR